MHQTNSGKSPKFVFSPTLIIETAYWFYKIINKQGKSVSFFYKL